MMLRARGYARLASSLGLTLLCAVPFLLARESAKKSTPEEIDQKIIAEVKERNEVQPNLTYISDVIGPRMTGSENLKTANNWTAEKFKSYGLENVHLEAWEIPAAWERGFCHLKMVEPNNGRLLTGAAAAWTTSTKERVTGEVVVIQASTKADLEKYKGKLKNALVMYSPPSPITPITEIGKPKTPPAKGPMTPGAAAPKVTQLGDTPKIESKDAAKGGVPGAQPPSQGAPGAAGGPSRPPFQRSGFGLRDEIRELARAEGAACILTDSSKPHGLLNMSGGWRAGDRAGANEPIPSVYLVHDHYAMLYRLATRKDAPPPKVEVEIQSKTIPGPIAVYNTVGEIKGSEKPDEFVVVGAHLDSWDLGQGTTDNGTGSTVVLEAARTLGKLAKEGIRPKRTIRFVLFTGEEQGLYGSKEYVKKHKDEMAKTSMALVHDTGTGRVTEIPLQGFDAAKPVLEGELTSLKELNVVVAKGTLFGTDHQSFNGVGVPGFAFRQDPAEYSLTHHSQSDTLDKARWPDLIQGSQVMCITAMRVANLPELLPREQTKGPGGPGGRGGRGGQEKKETPSKDGEKKPPQAPPEKKES